MHISSLLLARAARATAVAATLSLAAVFSVASAQESPHGSTSSIVDGVDYRVYDRSGQVTTLSAIVDGALSDEVLLVGEEHDDMIGHAFQTVLLNEVVRRIGSGGGSGRPVVLSLEMFERDV